MSTADVTGSILEGGPVDALGLSPEGAIGVTGGLLVRIGEGGAHGTGEWLEQGTESSAIASDALRLFVARGDRLSIRLRGDASHFMPGSIAPIDVDCGFEISAIYPLLAAEARAIVAGRGRLALVRMGPAGAEVASVEVVPHDFTCAGGDGCWVVGRRGLSYWRYDARADTLGLAATVREPALACLCVGEAAFVCSESRHRVKILRLMPTGRGFALAPCGELSAWEEAWALNTGHWAFANQVFWLDERRFVNRMTVGPARSWMARVV